MKRTLLAALLPLWAWAGCGSNPVPNTDGNCQGLVTVSITPASVTTSAKSIEVIDVGPAGERYLQTEAPPLAVPSVVLRLGTQYRTGNHTVRVVAAEAAPSKGSATAPARVTQVGRVVSSLSGACPTVQLSVAAPTLLDVCMDQCDAEARCGKRSFDELASCTAVCQRSADLFATQQADWRAQYKNADEMIGKLAGCTHVACSAVDACGQAVLESGTPK